jgi:Family of unknown function (DUF6918)
MPASLQETLLASDTQPKVLNDCYTLIEQQLSELSGVSGTAVKLAYKAVNAFKPGYYHERVEELLPQLVDKLEPYWADFTTSGGAEFGDYLAKRSPEVSESLLSITDAMAGKSDKPVIIKAYRTVRGNASKHVEAALPRVGNLVQKYAA